MKTEIVLSPATLLLLIDTEAVELQVLHSLGRIGMPTSHTKLARIRGYVEELRLALDTAIQQADCEHDNEVEIGREVGSIYYRCTDCGITTREDN